MIRIARTPWFKTVHPMTYGFVVQSIAIGVMILAHILFPALNALEVGELFWPEAVSIPWSVLLVSAGLAMLWVFVRDAGDKRVRIWWVAKINIVLWVFAMMVWIELGAELMMVLSVANILGFLYVAFAARFQDESLRI